MPMPSKPITLPFDVLEAIVEACDDRSYRSILTTQQTLCALLTVNKDCYELASRRLYRKPVVVYNIDSFLFGLTEMDMREGYNQYASSLSVERPMSRKMEALQRVERIELVTSISAAVIYDNSVYRSSVDAGYRRPLDEHPILPSTACLIRHLQTRLYLPICPNLVLFKILVDAMPGRCRSWAHSKDIHEDLRHAYLDALRAVFTL